METKRTDMQLKTIIGFDGNCPKSLRLHPDRKHILYPFGIKLAIQNLETKEQFFLEGHSNVISTIAISKSGKYIASGQINFMGFKAPVIVWDWETRKAIMEHDSHKVRVESVGFSCCENYVISLGGRDDSNLIVFNIHSKDPICGVFSSNRTAGDAVTLAPLNNRGICFVTGGVGTLKLWTLNPKERSVAGWDVSLGKLRRKVTCIEIDKEDHYAFCGTSTGDILKIKLNLPAELEVCEPRGVPALVGCYAKHQTRVKSNKYQPLLYSMGVRQIILTENKQLVVGSGDGVIELITECQPLVNPNARLSSPTVPLFKVVRGTTVNAFVTSLQLWCRKGGNAIIVGTMLCEMFLIDFETFSVTLMVSCHTSTIFDIAFPRHYSDVFATASKDSIRMWSASLGRELLRIAVPNFTCSSLLFTFDGRAILTGWNDGSVRAFTPQSGKLIFTIFNAHSKGVSAISITRSGRRLVTGGTEGQIRVWDIFKDKQDLVAVLKEHKGPVSSIDVSPNDKEAASASTDGTCIIWDIVKCVRIAILFSTTLFTCVRFHPSGSQILTCGTNRQIAYWEVFDGTLIREVEGSISSALNTLDISNDGIHFVTGSNDQMVKVWLYKEGQARYIGKGHGAVVTAVKVSPDMRTIVSCGADGAILIWCSPFCRPRSAKRRSSAKIASSSKDKEETVTDVSEKQNVISKQPTMEAPQQEGGSVKCYCAEGCTCKPHDLPKSPGPPPTPGSGFRGSIEDEGVTTTTAAT